MDNVEELGEEIASLSAHLDAATHHLLQCIRRFDEAAGWHEQGALSCAHWLPLIDEALRCGGAIGGCV